MNRSAWLYAAGLGMALGALNACERQEDAARVAEPAASAENAAQSVERATLPRHDDAPAGIAWFDGDVPAALARAAAEDKPVLLYWGAVWCPYCADLKAHVFSRRDVQEKLGLFVPVYLDGDDPGAQKWGETFGIAGYPTVLALAPDRTELARIAGGMDLSVYAEMLDLVLGDMHPLEQILSSLETRAGELSREDCRRLAYNGWGLDDSLDAQARKTAAALAKAVERCPVDSRTERARLAAIAASFEAPAEVDAIAAGGEGSELLLALVDDVRRTVAEPAFAASIADALLYLDEDFFAVARALDPHAAPRLLENWLRTMDEAGRDSRYTQADRLFATWSELEAAKGLGASAGEIPPALVQQAEARVDDALAHAAGTPAYPGVVNAAINVLASLGALERAHAVAEEAMKHSKTPYYYMADLAALDEDMGNKDAAVAWFARAYREAKGPATRFQWGTNYVRGLIRLTPHDEARVSETAIAVLGELDGPDRIYRRTRARLEALDASLRAWNADGEHDAAIAAIRHRMEGICANLPAEDSAAYASCRDFLAG